MFGDTPAYENTEFRVWAFHQQKVVFYQTLASRFSVSFATTFAREGSKVSRLLFEQHGPVHVVHDWLSIGSYELEARAIILQDGIDNRRVVKSATLRISPQATVFSKIAVSTGFAVLKALGSKIRLVNDLTPVLAEFGIGVSNR